MLYWEQGPNQIHLGHILRVLPNLLDKSVHMVVTSPPYWGLRDYGLEPEIWDGDSECSHEWGNKLSSAQRQRNKADGGIHADRKAGSQPEMLHPSQGQFCQLCNAWRGSLGLEPTPELYVDHMVQIFREVRRVLRDDGTLWLNLGDSYASQGGANPHTAPSGTGNNSKLETAIPARTPPSGLKPKDLIGIPWRVAFALQADGWYFRSDIIWHKPNPMPESVTDRPTKAHEYLFLLTKSQKYFYDHEAVKEPTSHGHEAKWDNGLDGHEGGYSHIGQGSSTRKFNKNSSTRNKRSVWTVTTKPFPGAHFATFPPKLIEPCVLAGTSACGCCPECGAPWVGVVTIKKEKDPNRHTGRSAVGNTDRNDGDSERMISSSLTIGFRPSCTHYDDRYRSEHPESSNSRKRAQRAASGDHWIRTRRRPGKSTWKITRPIVLDPFGGSGTTGIVADQHGRSFILVDLSEKYLREIMVPRVEAATKQMKLF